MSEYKIQICYDTDYYKAKYSAKTGKIGRRVTFIERGLRDHIIEPDELKYKGIYLRDVDYDFDVLYYFTDYDLSNFGITHEDSNEHVLSVIMNKINEAKRKIDLMGKDEFDKKSMKILLSTNFNL